MRAILRNPVAFAREVLNADLWDAQVELLHAIETHERVAVKGCHASGKTHVAALAVVGWIVRRKLLGEPDAVVITTSPSWIQVESQLWGEIHKAITGAAWAFPEPNQTEFKLGERYTALGLSTNRSVRFRGWHGSRVLIVVDEANGVDQEILDEIEGMRAGGTVHELRMANPTVNSGGFYDAFHTQRERWYTMTIGAEHTPNIRSLFPEGTAVESLEDEEIGDRLRWIREHEPDTLAADPRPYLCRRAWTLDRFEDWFVDGKNLQHWSSKVRGQFAAFTEDQLIALEWIERARGRPHDYDPQGPALEVGVDPADGGEAETVLAARQGDKVIHLQAWSKADAEGHVIQALRRLPGTIARIKVDHVGLGRSLFKMLRDERFPVLGVNVGLPPFSRAGKRATEELKQQFADFRAQAHWSLRERLQAGAFAGVLPEKAQAQLTSVRWTADRRGRTRIESKDDMKSRGVASPDYLDALVLAFCEPPVHEVPKLPPVKW